MAFVVIYDACVLYPAPMRDFLVRLALTPLVSARWTERILSECFDSIARNRTDLPTERLDRTRSRMCGALPQAMVRGYDDLISGLVLPDPDDRHVLAAAIRAGAQTIVTFNTKDFPSCVLDTYQIEARHPDDFVVDQIDINPGVIVKILQEQAAALRRNTVSASRVIANLRRNGLVQSTARLRLLFGDMFTEPDVW